MIFEVKWEHGGRVGASKGEGGRRQERLRKSSVGEVKKGEQGKRF